MEFSAASSHCVIIYLSFSSSRNHLIAYSEMNLYLICFIRCLPAIKLNFLNQQSNSSNSSLLTTDDLTTDELTTDDLQSFKVI